jgi:hypothetical protein
MEDGFANISDNVNFSGTNSNALPMSGLPYSWYGCQYRCKVNSNFSSIVKLFFVSTFNRSVDTLWGNSGNCSCNQLPDANTDVIISCDNNVVLNSNGVCRSLNSKQALRF